MIKNILQKCLTELSASQPRLDYIQGMLETLYAMQEEVTPKGLLGVVPKNDIATALGLPPIETRMMSEAEIMEEQTKNMIKSLPPIKHE